MNKLPKLKIKLDSSKVRIFLWGLVLVSFILELLFLYKIFADLRLKKSKDLSNTEIKIVEINPQKYTANDDSFIEKLVSSTVSSSQLVLQPTTTPLPTLSLTPSPTLTKPPGAYIEKVVLTDRGQFRIKMVAIDTSNGVKMITDSASNSLCKNNCPALPLGEYVKRNNGFAGINGTYFCPPDYPECKNKTNSFELLLYNSRSGNWINSVNNNNYGCPGVTAETDGIHFNKSPDSFIRRISDLHVINSYYSVYAALFHCLKLVEDKSIVVDTTKLSEKEKTRGTKSGIGVNGKEIYLIVANNVNLEDFASVFKSLDAEDAFALDGGGSSALWYEGYKAGPGRNIPNSIVFAYDDNPYPSPTPALTNATSQNILYLLKDSFENDLLQKEYDNELGTSTIIPSPVSIYLKLPSSIKISQISNPQIFQAVIGLPDAKLKTIYSQNIVTVDNNQYIITVNTIIADANGKTREQDSCPISASGISCFHKTFQEGNFVVNQEIFRDATYLYDSNGKFSIAFAVYVKKHRMWISIVKNNPTKYFSDEEIKMWVDLFSHVDVGAIIK